MIGVRTILCKRDVIFDKPASDQQKRLLETARQLECDEDKDRFEEKLKLIAKVKPKGRVKQ